MQDAELDWPAEGDIGAPGAAVTVALCGRWEHDPPCPIAPHHTRATRVDGIARVRTLFAVEPEQENEVRQRIVDALAEGQLRGPDGTTTSWRLRSSNPSTVTASETAHASRLTRA